VKVITEKASCALKDDDFLCLTPLSAIFQLYHGLLPIR